MHSLGFFLLIFTGASVFCAAAGGWSPMPGWIRQISAKGSELWAVNDYNTPLRWEEEKWVPKGYNIRSVAACGDYCAWAKGAIDRKDGNAVRFSNDSKKAQKFQPLSSKFSGFLDNINANSNESAVGVNSDGRLWRYWPEDDKWKHIIRNDPVRGFQVSIGDEDETWMVDYSNKVARLNGTLWEPVPAEMSAMYVDVQNAERVVVTDVQHKAYLWTGAEWKPLEGQECVQATVNNDAVFCVGPNGAVFRYDEDPETTTPLPETEPPPEETTAAPKKKSDKKKKEDEKKPDEKKPDEKKPDEKKPDEKKPDEKKPDDKKKPDEKKPEDKKKPDEKKPEDKKKPEEKKPDKKKPEEKKPDKKKPEEKKPEEKKPEENEPDDLADSKLVVADQK